MLLLSRKPGEEVVIDGNIRLTVIEIRGNQVKLGFTAPAAIAIRRRELCVPVDPSCKQEPRSTGSPPNSA
jgi:carbon storage regulator